MDIWQRLQQAPDDLAGCTAALQHLFGAGQLYASLAATTRQQPNLLREALPRFKEYLGYYAKSVDPYCEFPCHCPLCRGAQGKHYLRVLNLAEAVLMAWHCSTAPNPPVADSSGNPSIGSPDEMGGTSRREANPHTGSPHAVGGTSRREANPHTGSPHAVGGTSRREANPHTGSPHAVGGTSRREANPHTGSPHAVGGTSRRGANPGSPAIGSVEERLQQAAAYLHEAVRLLCPTAQPPQTISWSATDPLRDLLAQYTAQHPDPALNLIEELLHFYQHGQWRGFARRVVATFPLAFQNGGAIAKLALERTDALVPGFYSHPELLLATRWDEAFAQQFACAWAHHATDRNATLRWSLEPYRSEGTVWKGVAITGPSIGAAVGVALKCIENPNQPPPDIDCALTGKLEPDGTLGSVGGYHQKTLPFDRYSTLRLVIPRCDEPLAHACLPDWRSRLLPAPDIDQALQQATQLPAAVQRYLQQLIAKLDETPWYCNGQQLTNQRLFTPLRVLVTKPRRQEEGSRRPSEREGAEAQKEKPGDAYAELQAPLYELTREYAQKEEIRWEEFVRRVQHEKRAALIGAPGSGKTFGTRHLVLTLAQRALQQLQQGVAPDEIQIPLWLPATQLAQVGDLASAIAQFLPSAPREWLQRALEQGRFMLIIDALDELPTSQEGRFRACAQQLDAATGVVLVTCRTMHWDERSRWLGWRTLPDAAELAPLNPREQQAIAKQFFDAGAPEAQAMQRLLRESFVLRHACRTPLLLTFACLLHSENLLRSEFTYAQLYAHILRCLIRGTWRNAAEPLASSEVGEERVLCQLETLVWNLFLQSPERNLFTLDAWVRAGSNAPSAPLDPAELLETLERLGVVVAAGYDWRGYPQWSFAHRSILEFLAARHLSRQENWREEISQHFRFQPEWWEVLTFLAGLVENADPLVERLEQEQDDLFGSMLLLQARVVGFGRVSDAVAQRVAKRAVERYLSREIPEKFTLPPLQALGRHVVPLLVQALQDEHRWVRAAACEALGKIGDPQAIPPLLQALQDEDWEVRKAAYEALGAIGDPQAIPPLLQALKDEAWGVLEAACEALGKIGDPQAIPPLLQALKDEDWWIREAACEALGKIGDPQAIPHLIQALQDEYYRVREAACRALGRIGDPQAIPHLIQALQDEYYGVRRVACWALGAIGDPQAIPPLLQALQDEAGEVRMVACWALGAIGDPQAIPPLLQALKDEDRWVREAACGALGRIGDPQAIPHLIQALKDKDSCVRKAACEALGEIGDPQAIPHLIQALQDWDYFVRAAACEALGKIGDPQAIPHLAQALQDWDYCVLEAACREAACEALGAIGDPQAIPPLLQALKKDSYVRKAACEALGKIGDPQAIPPLLQALKKDSYVRKAACEALWRISVRHKVPIRQSPSHFRGLWRTLFGWIKRVFRLAFRR
jgi:HEAT repeat protein